MANSRDEVESFVIKYLMACFKDTQSRILEGEQKREGSLEEAEEYFQPWIDSEVFRDHLEGLHFCEVPETALLSKFIPVATMLVRRCLCLPMRSGPFSHSAVLFSIPHGGAELSDWVWAPSPIDEDTEAELERNPHIRFPYYPPLFDLLNSYGARNVPTEIWLGKKEEQQGNAPPLFMADPSIQRTLNKVRDDLAEAILARWNLLPSLLETSPASGRVVAERCTFLWMIEDWCLASRLMAGDTDFPMQFPVTLPTPDIRVLQLLGAMPISDRTTYRPSPNTLFFVRIETKKKE